MSQCPVISSEKQSKITYFTLTNNSLNLGDSKEHQLYFTSKTLFMCKGFRGKFPA